jgi:hypothetical protein
MRRTVFTGVSIFLIAVVLGCSGGSGKDKDKDSKSGKDGSSGSDVAKNEAVLKGMMEQLNALADALESVKDKETAKAAAAKINKAADRLDELGKEAKGLPKLSKEEEAKLQKKYQDDLTKAATRMQKAAGPAGLKSGGDPDFLKASMRLEEVGKALQSLDQK